MKRLVIAESSESICESLQRALCGEYEVHICKDGKGLPAVLEELRPEALIINLFLQGTDGLTVLQSCKYMPPTVLALTYFCSKSVREDAQAAGIGALLLLPCPTACIRQVLAQVLGDR